METVKNEEPNTLPGDIISDESKSEENGEENTKTPKVVENNDPEASLMDEVETLRAEVTALKERNLRNLADFDNQRKRLVREKEDWKKYSHENVVRDLLPTIDNFEMAIHAAGDGSNGKSITEGISMNIKMLKDVLKKHGVVEIDALHKPFDPSYHSAVSKKATSDYEPDTVTQVFQKGFMINDRLLRPAMVEVADAAQEDES